MNHYKPDHSVHDHGDHPTKRARREDRDLDANDRSYRKRSPFSKGHDSRPPKRHRDWAIERPVDRYRPNNISAPERQRSASPGRRIPARSEKESKNKKSHKERKENPSTRIRSLRNLLERGNLPATVQQEKERELAALLFDQQKDLIRQAGRKNLKRYHFIRFVERQKATRTLKQLKKQQSDGDTSEELAKEMHDAEVDVNYTLYSPLAQKYIAIFAREDGADAKQHPLARNLSRMKRQDYAMLDNEQQHEIEQASLEAANALHLADSTKGTKPPMWYVVEARMQDGRKALEGLRDEPLRASDLNLDLVVGMGAKKTPNWVKDDGRIDPEDLDSESDDDGGGAAIDAQNSDNEESDGDGGFFEKR